MFKGENLQQVRRLYGLSRRELGEHLNLSEQAIWQFENQMINPRFETIVALKELFCVKTQFFYKELTVKNVYTENKVAYRKADIVSRKKTSSEVEYMNVVFTFISFIESYLNVPHQDILSIRNTCLDIYYQENGNVSSKIEKIAALAKKLLDVKEDNSDLLYRIERSGIHVVEKNIGGQADAYSAWSKEEVPMIVLGIKKSAVRRNFDLAHELGHLLMHYNVDILSLEKEEYEQIEKEANLFASYFLMPENEFRKDMDQMKHRSNPDYYVPLKLKYNVSIQALELRAYKLGYLTTQQNSYFYRLIHKNNYRQKEPLDSELSLKRPGKIRNILNLVLEQQLMSIADMEDSLHVEIGFIERLLSIEKAFFEKYQEQDSFSSYGMLLTPNFKQA